MIGIRAAQENVRPLRSSTAKPASKTIVRNASEVKCVMFSYRFSARIANGVKVLVGRANDRVSL